MQSRSAKMLQDAITIKGVRCLRSKRRGIPWGPGIDKLTQFKAFEANGVSCVPFTDDIEAAQFWVNTGATLVAREYLSSHSGRGITIIKPGEPCIPAPLYTVYKKKSAEYRVHVCNGRTLIQKKMKKRSWDGERDTRIRNLANGYVFAFNFDIGRLPTDPLPSLGVESVYALQLNLGAVDVIFSKTDGIFYVLEVNTAPGLSTRTAEFYASALIGE